MSRETASLIAALEAAERGSAELDHALCRRLRGGCRADRRLGACPWLCPPYSTSIEAALTLIGVDCAWELAQSHGGLSAVIRDLHPELREYVGVGRTPAIAICLAALHRAEERAP